ncbi:short-chain dehydrogenase [Sphingobium lactosutens]|uniref:SDR family oxidoreductase n=1 Tax=Sphingobium lactosutens TaxID=522773 RepID=UPI0015BB6B1C|nr:SDR family oxidoreductase [Sphingobium lactosutens]NWK99160.1 short-chain dehydrogenase [Sphingobium lactosutens]
MSGRLTGKVALVTGAAKGLGEADARLFASEGAQVVLTDVDVDAGEALARSIGERALFLPHDVCVEERWAALISEIESRYGALHILVNNAGIVELGSPEGIDMADYHRIMAVSVDGVVLGCKYAIPAMRRAGSGSIINMASIAAAQGEPNVAAYSAAKGAVDAYSRCVAVYCAQSALAIRCNSVLPNGIDTPMVWAMPGKRADAGAESRLLPDVPGGQNERGVPEDIASLILYLASDDSRWINGQSFVVDNGASITKGVIPPRRPCPADQARRA